MLESFSAIAIKRILFAFNLFFSLTGLVLITFGVLIKSYFREYEPFIDDRYFSASSLLIASGSIIFIISFFGCCGAIKENRCMILTFSALLSLVMILEFACGITGFVLSSQTSELLDSKLNASMKLYKNYTDIQLLWDAVQQEFECCGINSPHDWNVSLHALPVSCCNETGALGNVSCTEESPTLFKDPCKVKLTNIIKIQTNMLSGVAFTIIASQFIGIMFACYLGRSIKQSNYETV